MVSDYVSVVSDKKLYKQWKTKIMNKKNRDKYVEILPKLKKCLVLQAYSYKLRCLLGNTYNKP